MGRNKAKCGCLFLLYILSKVATKEQIIDCFKCSAKAAPSTIFLLFLVHKLPLVRSNFLGNIQKKTLVLRHSFTFQSYL
uniref:Secreted protein n=1 Tax=Arundo donax TaxID=35708 RepID=A0A0A8ZRI8_ARUDO